VKVPIHNVYYLLCYAWEMWKEGQLVNVSNETFRSLPELFVRVLNSGVAHLLRSGLDRNYLREEDELRSPRGKFDFSLTVKRTLMIRSRIQCVYDEFSHNVLHNQIIKTTLGRAARWAQLDKGLGGESAQLYRRLHEISEIELAPSTFNRVAIHRNNRFCAFLVEVCRMLYHSFLVDPTTGESVFRDFLRDETAMGKLFERFVRNFYQREQVTSSGWTSRRTRMIENSFPR
jgi:5-methylcytosine-specific restriction enzyme subunit McrC